MRRTNFLKGHLSWYPTELGSSNLFCFRIRCLRYRCLGAPRGKLIRCLSLAVSVASIWRLLNVHHFHQRAQVSNRFINIHTTLGQFSDMGWIIILRSKQHQATFEQWLSKFSLCRSVTSRGGELNLFGHRHRAVPETRWRQFSSR